MVVYLSKNDARQGVKNKNKGVKEWRRRTKERMIQAMGGKCQCCGYDKCTQALEFHHLDPSSKDFSLGRIRANIRGWATIVEELKKCILLCSNCHREVHAEILSLPKVFSSFDPTYEEYKNQQAAKSFCPVCGKEKLLVNTTCSISCGAKIRYKINWDEIDLNKLMEENNNSYRAVGRVIGISDNSVKKRWLKLNKSMH